MRLASVSLAFLALGLQNGAQAGVFDGDALRENAELRRQVERQTQDVDARFNKLDEAIKNIGVIQLLQQIDVLNSEIAKLRGQIEVLANQNEQLQKRQRDFYLDLDTRLRRLEGAPPPVADANAPVTPPAALATTPPVPTATPPGASKDKDGGELRAYDDASNLFKKGDYARAVEAFSAFLRNFPSSPLAANSQYWVGMSYFNLRDFRNAQSAQEVLIKRFPDSPKVPDALLAIASVQLEQGDGGSARNTLEDIIARYPGTEAATKARTRLVAPRR